MIHAANLFSMGHSGTGPSPQLRPHSWYLYLALRYLAYTLQSRVIRVRRQPQASRKRCRNLQVQKGGYCCLRPQLLNRSDLGGLARPCHCRERAHIRRRVA